ncbi:MAG: response regulator [Prevotella sp.]|nr:response regulator [Prevotella sp.]
MIPFGLCASVIEHSAGFVVRPLGIEKGLSSNYVVDITQDRNGFMWFATEEGLNRFDGSRFYTYYKKSDGTGLSGNELNRLLADPHDPVIWIGTQRDGLNAYNYVTDRFTHYRHQANDPHSLITDDVTDIALARDGNLWISTYWDGIELLNKKTGRFTHFNRKTVRHLVSNQAWTVMDAGGDFIYVGHVQAGLSIINTRTHTARNFRHNSVQPGSLSDDNINCLYQDRNGHVWVGTDDGLDLFDPIKEEFIHIDSQGRLRRKVYAITEMADGQLYVGTEFGGIVIVNPSHSVAGGNHFPVTGQIAEGPLPTNLSGSTIRSLFQDRYHNIWVGFYGAGVNFISSQLPTIGQINYSIYKEDTHLTNKTVFGVATDRTGQLWLGTDGGGLNVFSPDKRRIAEYPTEAGTCVQAAYCDSRGTLWFGSYNQGARVKTSGGGFALVEGLPANADVREFHEDGRGRIWIATSAGIYVADIVTHRVTNYYSLNREQVRSISTDHIGRVWVGTFGNGLRVYSPSMKQLRSFSVSSRFPSNNVNHLLCDRQGRMWASTGNGIVLFPDRRSWQYKVYNQTHGLNNAHIRALAEDRKGNIWASTNKGISCLLKGDSTFVNYSYRDNLPMGNFNDASVAIQTDGTLVFGSTEGVAYFHPERLLSRREAPEVMITAAILPSNIDGKEDSIINLIGKQQLKLTYKENTFSLRFNIQNYALADRVEYAYMLRGTNDEWVDLHVNEVTLRDLPYGDYELLVKCRLRNQPWGSRYASIDLRITPPFWLSWPAKLLYALLAVAIVVALLRFYNRKIRLEYLYQSEKRSHEHEQELNQERLRFYTNITHELRTPLTLIMGPLADIAHDSQIPKEAKHKLAVIHGSAERLNNLINQLLEFRKTETENRRLCVSRGNIVSCVHETCLKYEELNRKDLVNIRFVQSDEPINIYFDKEVVTVVVDNLVSNAIKYTDRGEITITVERRHREQQNLVEITVADTGHGISAEALPHIFERFYQENGHYQASGTGIGLALVKKLVDLHHGTITVDSTPGQGSTFRVTLNADAVYPDSLHQEGDADREKEVLQPSVAIASEPETAGKELPIVVVVEDNKDIRDYIAESFATHYDVRTAENGRAGLALAFDVTPDIIISDIMMPVMDGNELCRRLKADVRTSHIPVILLTAKDAISAKEEGYEAGADSYLTKPFTSSLLEARVRNLLQQRRLLLQSVTRQSADSVEQKREQLRAALNEIDRQFYDKVNGFIEARISGDVDVNYLADNLNMSASTLYRKMRAITGVSTNEYIRQYKMHYAEKLLLEGKWSISEVSFMVGINSVPYFRKCFKDEFGMLPSEYIKKFMPSDQ